MYGYPRLKETIPKFSMQPLVRPPLFYKEDLARQVMLGAGYSEAVLMGFANDDDSEIFGDLNYTSVRVANPLSSELTVMRTALLTGLLNAAKLNISRQRTDIRLFTLQRVYHKHAAKNFRERLHLAAILTGSRSAAGWDGQAKVDFYDLKGALEGVLQEFDLLKLATWRRCDDLSFLHPGRSAYLLVGDEKLGFVGQLHPDVQTRWDIPDDCYVFEIDFETLTDLSAAKKKMFTELSKYPFMERDLAVVVDEEIEAADIFQAIMDCEIDLIDEIRVFDVYRGKGIDSGKKSMAYGIKYVSRERTLTDEEVNNAHAKVIKVLEDKLGAILRT